MGTLREDLACRAEEVRETHISWVFLHDTRVLKVKKPVDFGFLDFRTLTARRLACEAEVTLNRRLAPDVYLGIRAVVRDADGNHRIGPAAEGEVVDWAVEMVRLPDAHRADVLLERGALDSVAIDRLAQALARFHQRCVTDEHIRSFGSAAQIRENVEENFAQTCQTMLDHLSSREAASIERAQLDYLALHEAQLVERIDHGRIREGHGDLRLEHVYLDGDALQILDCIEFNERFRHADVAADLAFLSMDLAWHGRVDLAERLLATYARASGDFGLYAVVDFYEGYRAFVRGKIASLIADDRHATPRARERAHTQARRYFLLALATSRPPLLPPLVISVGGLIASGKSSVADDLGLALGAPVISSDHTRKRLHSVPPEHSLADTPGAYGTDANLRVQEEMLRNAQSVLASRRPVIFDATHRTRESREAARALAREHGVPYLFIECRAPLATLRSRLEERVRHGGSESDAGPELLERFVSLWEAPTELPEDEHLVLDTTLPLADNRALLRAHINGHPGGLTG